MSCSPGTVCSSPARSRDEHLLRKIKLCGLGQVRDVPGVQRERRLLRQAVDQFDGLRQRAADVRIGVLAEADVRVADLQEQRLPSAPSLSRRLAAAARSMGVRTPPLRAKRVPAPPKAMHCRARRRDRRGESSLMRVLQCGYTPEDFARERFIPAGP